MTKKYFFFDIDGTLTEKTSGKVVPSAIEAVHRLEQAGHFVCLATGRALYKAKLFAEKNGFRNMVFFGGNGICLEGKVLEFLPLDREKALRLYDQAVEAGFGILAAADDSQKVYASNFLFYDQCGPRQEPTTYIIDKDFDPSDIPNIYKLYISVPIGEEDRLPALNEIGHLRFVPEYLIIQPDNKYKGILRMLEHIGGKPENTVVFGDDDNDLIMFSPPFYRVAMGNATEKLKNKADYITDNSIDNGILNACIHHGWI